MNNLYNPIKIKACHGCGSDDVYAIEKENNIAWAGCKACDCKGPTMKNAESAITIWNKNVRKKRMQPLKK